MKVYVPEINTFFSAISLTIDEKNFESIRQFHDSVINDSSLSELSKFFSILIGLHNQVDPELTHAENGIIAGLIIAQATAAAASAFVSTKADPISKAISSAIAAGAVTAANSTVAHQYYRSRTIKISSILISSADDSFKSSEYVKGEEVLVASLSTLTAIPLTPAYLAGKILVQVASIAGGFAFAVAIGKMTGALTSKISNSIKLTARKRELKKKKKDLKKEMVSEQAKVASNVTDEDLTKYRPNYDSLSQADKDKTKQSFIKEKKEKIRREYHDKDGGLITFNNSQITGLANYQLYLQDSGFSTPIQPIIKATNALSKKAVAGIAGAAGLGGVAIGSLVNKASGGRSKLSKILVSNDDNGEDSFDSTQQIIGIL